MAMWMSNMSFMIWTFTMAMPTIPLANLHKSSRALFDGGGMTPLYEAMLEGKEVCMFSLSKPPRHLGSEAKPLQ